MYLNPFFEEYDSFQEIWLLSQSDASHRSLLGGAGQPSGISAASGFHLILANFRFRNEHRVSKKYVDVKLELYKKQYLSGYHKIQFSN